MLLPFRRAAHLSSWTLVLNPGQIIDRCSRCWYAAGVKRDCTMSITALASFTLTLVVAAVLGLRWRLVWQHRLGVAIKATQMRADLALRGSDVALFEAEFPDGSLTSARWTFFNMWESLGFDGAGIPRRIKGVLPLALHPDDRPAIVARFEAAVRSRSPNWYVEHRVLHRDGSVRWRLLRGTLTFDDAGRITSLVGAEADITQLKQNEHRLALARKAAESANRTKDELLAYVSHEIRTPINAVLGMTELAIDGAPSVHQRQLLSTVHSAAASLLAIVDDLLDFSKIEAGKLALDCAHFSLRTAVGDTLRALAVRARHKGLELLWRVAPEIPDLLYGDVGRLRQVLTNLIGNAIKFTRRGSVEVDVRHAPSSDALVFSVRDTGIGIAAEKQALIFCAFEQEDPSITRKFGGTGLGLTIAAQLAALMGGDIRVESAPGCGSTFRFTVPFLRSPHAEAISISRGSTPSGVAEVMRSFGANRALRVLVGEDNELNVALLRELLRRRGHSARFADNGLTALELAVRGEYDLLLLDLHMPRLDGFSVVRAIRERERVTGRRLPIIALTARSSARDRERCLAAGMDAFLSKPIEAAVLWTAVDRLVAGATDAEEIDAIGGVSLGSLAG